MSGPKRRLAGWIQIRKPIGWFATGFYGALCLAICFGLWWWMTSGATVEDRLVSPDALPSPSEAYESVQSLWGERKLAANTWVTLKRVTAGFALAAAIGVPLGVLAGCFPPVASFLAPLVIFGRNIPIAALIPLTFFFFGIAETQKVMFIFIACVAFVIADSATSIANVGQAYIDTAYTLGAGRRQVIMKVLVPLAMPGIFDSLRLLFGLAFGYIMLAESIRFGSEEGGLGNLISISQRRGPRSHIFLIILIIPLVALMIDRILYWMQRQFFPYRYGGPGWLLKGFDGLLYVWESAKGMIIRPRPPFDQIAREFVEAHPESLVLTDADRQRLKEKWKP